MNSQELIALVCDEVKELLLTKNKAYGDSALAPKRIFSQSDALEQIRVRIDDKLSRIASGATGGGEDTRMDLIGYLILEQIAIRKQKGA
jgi:hypothetical protein